MITLGKFAFQPKTIAISFVVGILITLATGVTPVFRDQIKGPSCPACLDIDGGEGYQEKSGLPFYYLQREYGPWVFTDESGLRNNVNYANLVVDAFAWSIATFVVLNVITMKKGNKNG